MRRMVEKIFRYHGQDMVIDRAGEKSPVRGFLQAVTGTAREKAVLQAGPLGLVSSGRYMYFGPMEPELRQGDTLVAGDKSYTVRRAETVSGTYVWGMCVEKGSEDTWGLNG